MRILRFAMPAAFLVLALSGPISANHGGYHHADVLTGIYATPFASSAHEFAFDIAAGESISATVEWFDPSADLDLLVIPPGGGCVLLPEPDTACLIGSVENTGNRVTCPSGSDGRTLLGPSPETLTYTAGVSGVHRLVVAASAGDVVVSGIQYVLSVNGGANFQPPETGNWFRLDACRSL